MAKYTILKDTREKTGWDFPAEEYCLGTEIATLKTGDYTIKEHQSLICVERKKSVEELAGNLGKNRKRFERELDRMRDFKYSFLVCEFSLHDLLRYPQESNLPKSKRKYVVLTGKYLLKLLIEYQLEYGLNVIFCETAANAVDYTKSLFKRINESASKTNDRK